MTDRTVVRVGGLALIGGAVAFMAVFTWLAAKFDYPEVLDGAADAVLPNLLAMGTTGRLVWAIYALLPLIWIPASIAAYEVLGRSGWMRLGIVAAAISTMAMMLGLMRWPALHWELARAFEAADAGERAVISAIFLGLNTYLGNYIGECLGELAFSIFFLVTSITWLRRGHRPKWVGWLGVVTAISGLIGMFRNVTGVVAPFAELNNYLLPAFMIILGVALIRTSAGRDNTKPTSRPAPTSE